MVPAPRPRLRHGGVWRSDQVAGATRCAQTSWDPPLRVATRHGAGRAWWRALRPRVATSWVRTLCGVAREGQVGYVGWLPPPETALRSPHLTEPTNDPN